MNKIFSTIGLALMISPAAFAQSPAGVPADATNTVAALISYEGPLNPVPTADYAPGDTQINYSFVDAPVSATYYVVEFDAAGDEVNLTVLDATAGGDIDSEGVALFADGTPWYFVECFYALPSPPKDGVRAHRGIIHRQVGTGRIRGR